MSSLEVVTATLRGMVASVNLQLLATLCALSHVHDHGNSVNV